MPAVVYILTLLLSLALFHTLGRPCPQLISWRSNHNPESFGANGNLSGCIEGDGGDDQERESGRGMVATVPERAQCRALSGQLPDKSIAYSHILPAPFNYGARASCCFEYIYEGNTFVVNGIFLKAILVCMIKKSGSCAGNAIYDTLHILSELSARP